MFVGNTTQNYSPNIDIFMSKIPNGLNSTEFKTSNPCNYIPSQSQPISVWKDVLCNLETLYEEEPESKCNF